MKEVYMIYEKDLGHTGVTFEDEKSAQEYLKLLNETVYNAPYYLKKNTLYTNLDEYIDNNKLNMIEMLKKSIEVMTDRYTDYKLKFKNGIHEMNYDCIKEVVKKNKLNMIAFFNDDKVCEVVKSDLQVVIDKYNEINNKIKEKISKIFELENSMKTNIR